MFLTKYAFKILKRAIKKDDGYADTWQANIAMACYDAIRSADEETPGASADDTQRHLDVHKISNDAASRFMKLCFDVNVSPYCKHGALRTDYCLECGRVNNA